MSHRMHRVAIYTLQEVLPFVVFSQPNATRPQKDYDGYPVYMDSLRYHTFVRSGTRCIACGLQATYFALEQHLRKGEPVADRFHLNLYGTHVEGHEVLFTKDHIIPRSKGGPDKISNLQTMCQPCNTRKGSDCIAILRYQKSRSRVKRLRTRIQKQLAANKAARKLARVAGVYCGGHGTLERLKSRVKVLNARMERIALIDKAIRAERSKANVLSELDKRVKGESSQKAS